MSGVIDGRYWLNRMTGEVIDQCSESLIEYRRKTEDWPTMLITVSKQVYDKFVQTKINKARGKVE